MENFTNKVSDLLSGIELDKIDLVFYLLLGLMLINFITLSIVSSRMKKRLAAVPAVSANTTLNETLSELNSKINDLSQYKAASANQIKKITESQKTVKKIETKKYNPFADAGVGGLQSFSTAMIDNNGNGIIISSLYSRTSTRVTLKEVESWNPMQELSPEEKEVLEKTKV